MQTFMELLIVYKNNPKGFKLRTMTYMYGPNLLCRHVKLHTTSPPVFAYMSTTWNNQFSSLNPSSNITSSKKSFMVSKEIFFVWASITYLHTSQLYILEPSATRSTCPAAVLRCLIFFPIQGSFLKHLFFSM